MPRINLAPFMRRRFPSSARDAFYRRPYSMSDVQAMAAIGSQASPSSPIGSSPLGWYHMMYPKTGSPVLDAGIDVPPFAPGTSEPGTGRSAGAYAAYGGGGYSSGPQQQTYSGGGGGGTGFDFSSITTFARNNPIIVVVIVVALLFAFFQFGKK